MRTSTLKKESKGMDDLLWFLDDLIFLLSVNLFGLILIYAFDKNMFAAEAVWAIVNTMLTMYFYYKHKVKK